VWDILDAVKDVADRRGLTMAQVALAWTADQAGVVSPILGNRTGEQLAEALTMADTHLDDDDLAHLTEVSAPDLPQYPYGPMGQSQRSRPINGGRAS
jgi:aryl-alcohol dehydrogenase-like predicted oxidoreductase